MLYYEPQANVNNSQWAGLVTRAYYDLQDCSTWVMVPQVANSTDTGLSYFEIWHGNYEKATIAVAQDSLTFTLLDGPSTTNDDVPYDSASHRLWRIREADGQLFLETGPDGTSWTAGLTVTSPQWVNDVQIGLGGRVAEGLSHPGATAFDNLDLLP